MTLRHVFLVTTGLAVALPARAQLRALPVYSTAASGSGLELAVDYGRDLVTPVAPAQHVGGRATLSVGPASLEIGAGLWDAGSIPGPSDSARRRLQASGNLGLRVMGDRASPVMVGLQLGVGYLRSDGDAEQDSHLSMPLSVGMVFRPVAVAGKGVRPWLAPRVELHRVTFSQVALSHMGLGATGGFTVAITGRVGLHGALDWSYFGDRRVSNVTLFGGSRIAVGAGAHVRIGAVAPGG